MTPEREQEIRDNVARFARAFGVTMAEFGAGMRRLAEQFRRLNALAGSEEERDG